MVAFQGGQGGELDVRKDRVGPADSKALLDFETPRQPADGDSHRDRQPSVRSGTYLRHLLSTPCPKGPHKAVCHNDTASPEKGGGGYGRARRVARRISLLR
jgi:hypothetical protein